LLLRRILIAHALVEALRQHQAHSFVGCYRTFAGSLDIQFRNLIGNQHCQLTANSNSKDCRMHDKII
jgi:hypothetical protein